MTPLNPQQKLEESVFTKEFITEGLDLIARWNSTKTNNENHTVGKFQEDLNEKMETFSKNFETILKNNQLPEEKEIEKNFSDLYTSTESLKKEPLKSDNLIGMEQKIAAIKQKGNEFKEKSNKLKSNPFSSENNLINFYKTKDNLKPGDESYGKDKRTSEQVPIKFYEKSINETLTSIESKIEAHLHKENEVLLEKQNELKPVERKITETEAKLDVIDHRSEKIKTAIKNNPLLPRSEHFPEELNPLYNTISKLIGAAKDKEEYVPVGEKEIRAYQKNKKETLADINGQGVVTLANLDTPFSYLSSLDVSSKLDEAFNVIHSKIEGVDKDIERNTKAVNLFSKYVNIPANSSASLVKDKELCKLLKEWKEKENSMDQIIQKYGSESILTGGESVIKSLIESNVIGSEQEAKDDYDNYFALEKELDVLENLMKSTVPELKAALPGETIQKAEARLGAIEGLTGNLTPKQIDGIATFLNTINVTAYENNLGKVKNFMTEVGLKGDPRAATLDQLQKAVITNQENTRKEISGIEKEIAATGKKIAQNKDPKIGAKLTMEFLNLSDKLKDKQKTLHSNHLFRLEPLKGEELKNPNLVSKNIYNALNQRDLQKKYFETSQAEKDAKERTTDAANLASTKKERTQLESKRESLINDLNALERMKTLSDLSKDLQSLKAERLGKANERSVHLSEKQSLEEQIKNSKDKISKLKTI